MHQSWRGRFAGKKRVPFGANGKDDLAISTDDKTEKIARDGRPRERAVA